MSNQLRAYADISIDALLNNYHSFEALVGENTIVMAIVKADAYGHGAKEVALALEKAGCRYFGVACLDEAMELRSFGIKSHILIFGRTDLSDIEMVSKNHLIQSIHSVEYAMQIDELGFDIDAHIKIDTGMSRYGIYTHEESNIESTLAKFRQIAKLDHINIEGIYTHFADAANEDDAFTKKQFELFHSIVSTLKKDHVCHGICHCANTAATIKFPQMHLSMVRIGIGLYGYPQVKTDLGLKPVMSVYGEVSDIHTLKTGDTISYGRTFLVSSPMKVATISIGYADGYLRGSSNQDYFYFHGKKLPQIGTICMDACMVDVTNVDIKIGDFVEIFGTHKSASIIARQRSTIDYEVLCAIGKRVHRIYK